MAQPYTITYGPWSPDLQNVAVQMPVQWGATPLPVADCQNVYYQDGATRCLPSPASIGPALGVPVTNAVNWYDDSTGKEEVFAATANGLYVLEDGTWSAVPIQSNSATTAIGNLLQITPGAPNYLTFSPESQARSGTSSSYLFPVEDIEGVPAGIGPVWSVSGASGGTWSVADGQGSNVSQAQVTGVSAGTTASASYNCQVTINGVAHNFSAALSYGYMTGSVSGNASGSGAGTVTTNSVTASAAAGVGALTYSWSAPAGVTANFPSSASTTFSASTSVSGTATCTITDANGTQVFPTCSVSITSATYSGSITSANSGYFVGYQVGNFGSIAPTADKNGHTIGELFFDASAGTLTLEVNATLPSTYFSTLKIGASSFSASSASFLQNAGNSYWSWTVGNPLAGTQTWSYL